MSDPALTEPEWGTAAGLLVLAESGRDPDLAPLVAPAHLGESFVVWWRGERPRLAYLTDMERDEAAATGLELLTPRHLGVRELQERSPRPADLWAALLETALGGRQPATLLLGGRLPAGVVHEAVGRLEADGWSFLSGEPVLRRWRRRKGPRLLTFARRSAAGAVDALRRTAELLAAAAPSDGRLLLEGEPLTAGRLRREIALTLAAFGLEQPEGNIVAVGAEAGVPHSRGDDGRVIERGATVVVDLFPRGELFADVTRTFCVGEPSPEVAEAHAAVREALERARGEAAPGAEAFDLQRSVCAGFSERGYANPIDDPGTVRGYVHGLGHGVGFELHELPSFRRQAGDEGVLAEGDLLTLEPGLYEPDRGWGIRLEDLIYLGSEGPEDLTPLPYDLDPRAWAP